MKISCDLDTDDIIETIMDSDAFTKAIQDEVESGLDAILDNAVEKAIDNLDIDDRIKDAMPDIDELVQDALPDMSDFVTTKSFDKLRNDLETTIKRQTNEIARLQTQIVYLNDLSFRFSQIPLIGGLCQ